MGAARLHRNKECAALALVALHPHGAAIVAIGLHEWAGARFKRGDQTAIPLMFLGGRLAGAAILLAMLSAVFTFN